MDIYCPKCGQAFAVDELHDAPNSTFDDAAAQFRRIGCNVFGEKHQTEPDAELALAARTAMTMSPHPDDWAADLDGLF